jgi:hypothetical protein
MRCQLRVAGFQQGVVQSECAVFAGIKGLGELQDRARYLKRRAAGSARRPGDVLEQPRLLA